MKLCIENFSFARKSVFDLAFLLFLLVSLCISSCADEIERPSASAGISFIIRSGAMDTRSVNGIGTSQDTVTALLGGASPLYIHTLYTDKIDCASFCNDDKKILSRSTPITDLNMYDSFGVSAYSYTDSWSESKTPNYFYNVTASKSGGNYTLSSTYYYPGASYKMKFFAYAPKDNGNYVLSANTQTGSPTISVTIPGNVDDQKDLLVAKTDELDGNTNTVVPLTFSHALTAIRFVCGDDMQGGTVKSVSLKNVYSKGTYNMETESWSSVNTPATFSQTLNKSTAGTANDPLVTENQTFMMVPQTLPDGAQLEVVFTDNANTDHTLSADIRGQAWPIGKTVTYKISNSSINWNYNFSLGGEDANVDYTGGRKQLTVVSNRTDGKGTSQPVPWSIQYSTDNGNSWSVIAPEWVVASPESGTEQSKLFITYLPQEGTDTSDHTAMLKNSSPKGSDAVPYNLSNPQGLTEVINTANCYVVGAPGVYSLPLIYGNAIAAGASNPSAYTSKAVGTNILSTFVNHRGAEISAPEIYNNMDCHPSQCGIVWQDAYGLVSDVRLSEDYHSLIFKVDKRTIRQGNAVLAVYDASHNIMWSWHIWVTDTDMSRTVSVTNYQNEKSDFMPVNLGACDENVITYNERRCKVKLISAYGQVLIKELIQSAARFEYGGKTGTFYQWGRKDPIPPGTGKGNVFRTVYNADGTVMFDPTKAYPTEEFPSDKQNIAVSIQKPEKRMSNKYRGCTYTNLWNADESVLDVLQTNVNLVKTVYDPCPVGFCVPGSRAFTGFTTNGRSQKTMAEINVDGGFDQGFSFYTGVNKTGSTFFFPASGYSSRNWLGQLRDVGDLGHYWTSVRRNPDGIEKEKNEAWGLGFYVTPSLYLNPIGSIPMINGCSIRGVKQVRTVLP